MKIPPLPDSEKERLASLYELELLDTKSEDVYDEITKLASILCGTPIAAISLIDTDRQWFKSITGLSVSETARDISFCGHTILGDDLMEVSNACMDERFSDNPLVLQDPQIRFYAGMPLKIDDKHNIGSLCVIDRIPKKLTNEQKEGLKALAHLLTKSLEQRSLFKAHMELRREIANKTAVNDAIVSNAGTAIISTDLEGVVVTFNPTAEEILGYSSAEMVGKFTPALWHDEEEVLQEAESLSKKYGETVSPGFQTFVRPLQEVKLYAKEWTYIRKDGTRIPVMLKVSTLLTAEGEAIGYLGVARDITSEKKAARLLESNVMISKMAQRCQEAFITGQPASIFFNQLLNDLLNFTGSEYGFIGETLNDDDGPYLRTYSITDISWSEETKKLYEEYRQKGFVFKNHKTLFGVALVTQEVVISNDPANDPRRGGLPHGHPPMRSFLGMPCRFGGNMVGLVGIANRPGGYSMELVTELEPLLNAIGALIEALRLSQSRETTRQSLAAEKDRFQKILMSSKTPIVESTDCGLVAEWNASAVETFGVSAAEAVGNKMTNLFVLRDAQGHEGGLIQHFQRQEDFSADGKELTIIRRDGTHFPAQVIAWKVAHETSHSVCAFIRDMTARYDLEAQQRKRFESETMLKEIHHRVKNNMQVISSLLSLQSAHMDPSQRGVFMECRDRIRAMSLIHEKLYTTGQFGAIDFGEYLREMVTLVSSSNKPADTEIDYDIQVESIEVSLDQAVPLSLIASELILNSMKHAFHDRAKGLIIVRLHREDGVCRLFIGDDGPGIPPEEHRVNSQSIGMKLIDGLSKQIRAQLEKYPGPGAGLTVRWKL
jgi:PAS domain S-box-containing protein